MLIKKVMNNSPSRFRLKNILLPVAVSLGMNFNAAAKEAFEKKSQDFSHDIKKTAKIDDFGESKSLDVIGYSGDREKVLKKVSKIAASYNKTLEKEFLALPQEHQDSLFALDSMIVELSTQKLENANSLSQLKLELDALPGKLQAAFNDSTNRYPESYKESLQKDLDQLPKKIKELQEKNIQLKKNFELQTEVLKRAYNSFLPQSSAAYTEAYNDIVNATADYNSDMEMDRTLDPYISPEAYLNLVPTWLKNTEQSE